MAFATDSLPPWLTFSFYSCAVVNYIKAWMTFVLHLAPPRRPDPLHRREFDISTLDGRYNNDGTLTHAPVAAPAAAPAAAPPKGKGKARPAAPKPAQEIGRAHV